MTRIYTYCAVGASALVTAITPARAAQSPDYPTRPVRLLVPFAPGGGADTLARIVTPKLSESMGQQWVVDNRGGAGGNIAAETVARAAPDGYTVFMGFSTVLTVNPSLYKLDFNMERDLQPVTLLASAQYILVVHPSVQASTGAALIDEVDVHPRSGRIKLALGPDVPALDGKTILIAPTRDANDRWQWMCIPVDIPRRWLPRECR